MEVKIMFDLIRRNSNAVNTYNPFREMEELERRFFGNDFFRMNDLAEFKTDVTDEGDHFLLEADLPGFRKEDIQLDLDGDVLTIRAERHSNVERKEKDKVVRVERSYGSYSRQFDITNIKAEEIKAKYDNGVLQLTLPKQDKVLPSARQIAIE